MDKTCIKNSSISHKALAMRSYLNVSWGEIETGIKDEKILIDFAEYFKNKTMDGINNQVKSS